MIKDWDESDYYVEKYIHGTGTHAFMVAHLYPSELAIGEVHYFASYFDHLCNSSS